MLGIPSWFIFGGGEGWVGGCVRETKICPLPQTCRIAFFNSHCAHQSPHLLMYLPHWAIYLLLLSQSIYRQLWARYSLSCALKNVMIYPRPDLPLQCDTLQCSLCRGMHNPRRWYTSHYKIARAVKAWVSTRPGVSTLFFVRYWSTAWGGRVTSFHVPRTNLCNQLGEVLIMSFNWKERTEAYMLIDTNVNMYTTHICIIIIRVITQIQQYQAYHDIFCRNIMFDSDFETVHTCTCI